MLRGTPNSLRLSRPGQRPRGLNEAKVAPTPGRADDAGALGRPAAAGYTAGTATNAATRSVAAATHSATAALMWRLPRSDACPLSPL